MFFCLPGGLIFFFFFLENISKICNPVLLDTMITTAYIPALVPLDSEEIPLAMLWLIGLPEAEQAIVMKMTEDRITDVRKILRIKLGGGKSAAVPYGLLKAKFAEDCTLKGEDIFTDEQKRRLLLFRPDVVFRFPPGKKK